ncbi:hypothetical protein O9992_27885 [Vibrio lentus]|nr:hypothetical protein [Vibrio lentus]
MKTSMVKSTLITRYSMATDEVATQSDQGPLYLLMMCRFRASFIAHPNSRKRLYISSVQTDPLSGATDVDGDILHVENLLL